MFLRNFLNRKIDKGFLVLKDTEKIKKTQRDNYGKYNGAGDDRGQSQLTKRNDKECKQQGKDHNRTIDELP